MSKLNREGTKGTQQKDDKRQGQAGLSHTRYIHALHMHETNCKRTRGKKARERC